MLSCPVRRLTTAYASSSKAGLPIRLSANRRARHFYNAPTTTRVDVGLVAISDPENDTAGDGRSSRDWPRHTIGDMQCAGDKDYFVACEHTPTAYFFCFVRRSRISCRNPEVHKTHNPELPKLAKSRYPELPKSPNREIPNTRSLELAKSRYPELPKSPNREIPNTRSLELAKSRYPELPKSQVSPEAHSHGAPFSLKMNFGFWGVADVTKKCEYVGVDLHHGACIMH